MNILIISHMYPSENGKINGVFVHEQVKKLNEKGHEVRVISPVPYVPPLLRYISPRWKKYESIPNRGVYDGIDVFYPKYIAYPKNINFSSSGYRMYWGIKNAVKELSESFNFDIIHAHVALPDGYAAMKIAKLYKVPFLVTIHGQDLQHTIHKKLNYKKKISRVLNESNKIILVSNKLNNIRKQYLPEIDDDKFIVIYNGVSDNFLNIEYLEKKCRSDIKILSVSNLLRTKGIDLNIYAIAQIVERYPNIIYYIIGEGPEMNSMKQLVKNLNLEKSIIFLGRKSRLDVRKYMLESDIFLLPSWNEAFGVVYIEAMACGLPVIGCKREGIEDIVKDGVDGFLIEPKSINDIVKKTINLIERPDIRYEIGVNARKKVEKRFTWEIISSQIIKLYKNFV
ncbi:glycosyltransferase [Oceanobacillus picturae]|uniref:glycosyltransferase n=1 Tax=Oceanobacillus picturae TaxID=171693 RepID=UPI000E68B760|nr:glycosyltransferase [Oceanobacillus picturae]RIU94753.1 glycosyltransferase family 4 protein [Oceanobacillus picturae]